MWVFLSGSFAFELRRYGFEEGLVSRIESFGKG